MKTKTFEQYQEEYAKISFYQPDNRFESQIGFLWYIFYDLKYTKGDLWYFLDRFTESQENKEPFEFETMEFNEVKNLIPTNFLLSLI